MVAVSETDRKSPAANDNNQSLATDNNRLPLQSYKGIRQQKQK